MPDSSANLIDAMLKPYPDLMNERDLVALGVASAKTLRNWRISKSGGIPFVKCGANVRYFKTAVAKYLERNTVGVTD